MSRYAASRAYVFLLLSSVPLLLGQVQVTNVGTETLPLVGIGPQATITCPAGAVNIVPGQSIQFFVNSYPGGTTFCLRAGVHYLTSSITPKTGDTFVGEYGAVLDGSRWATSDGTAAAFRAHNNAINDVTIRNLVIRRMPQNGIQAYLVPSQWTIEYNEIANCKYGLEFGPNFIIRHNYIHHNVGDSSSRNPAERGGGYIAQHADQTILESNEIAYNGFEQKVAAHSANVTFRNNFVHHNLGDGIWYDTNANAGALIEGNRVEDNGRNGIDFEASIGATIRNNILRRNAAAAVFISMSQNAQIYNNSLEANFGSIQYFLNCVSLLEEGHDLENNAAYENTVVVGTQSYAYANRFSSTSCTSAQLTPYLNGSKNLTFSRNAYRVPSPFFARYFLWGNMKFWNEWQALGHDVDGSISQ